MLPNRVTLLSVVLSAVLSEKPRLCIGALTNRGPNDGLLTCVRRLIVVGGDSGIGGDPVGFIAGAGGMGNVTSPISSSSSSPSLISSGIN